MGIPLWAPFKDFTLFGGLHSHACEQCIRPLMDKLSWSPNLVKDSGYTNTSLRILFLNPYPLSTLTHSPSPALPRKP